MEIQLSGYLKELHPDPIKVEASSVAEAISSLQILPAFSPRTGKKFNVMIDGFHSRDAIYDTDNCPSVITIRPVAAGAGRSGWTQIVIGAILITAAIMTAGAGLTVAGVTISSGSMMLAGSMMVLGGVLSLIAPQPKFDSGNEERSKYLGQGKNTVAIGTRIPMIYGRRKWGGHYISFNINSGDLNAAPAAWYSSPFTDYGDSTYSAAPADTPLPPIDQYDGQPVSTYTGLSAPAAMTNDPQSVINFSPSVQLESGEWDITFSTGQTLHVMVDNTGVQGQATLIGGSTLNLPPVGTSIVFTQNYG